jgi:hypothetical protein
MSTRCNNGSHYENHQRADWLQDMGAHAHRLASEHHYKQGHQTHGATSVVQNAARNGAGSPSTARAGRPDACARNEGELSRVR